MQKKPNGFTLMELVLVLTLLGVLAIAALPSFMSLSTQARQTSRDSTVAAVRAGIQLFRANSLINGSGNYPMALDGALSASKAGAQNPFFTAVLPQGIIDSNWSKGAEDIYLYNDGTKTEAYTYSAANGTFTGTLNP